MTKGPQMVGVYANTAFDFYSGGTFTGCPLDAVHFINHAILLVGWTKTGWICKNQWGTSWGEAGYIEIDFVRDCGLRYLMGSVTVSNKNNNVQVKLDTGYVASNQVQPEATWEGTLIIQLFTTALVLLLVL